MIEASGVHQFTGSMTLAVIMANAKRWSRRRPTSKGPLETSSSSRRRSTRARRAPSGAAARAGRPLGRQWGIGRKLSRDLDEAVEVLPATRLENDRGTGTAEDANGNTLSPGLDRSRD